MNFEDFHIVANKELSDQLAASLQTKGVRIQQRVIMEIGRPEYVIAVHLDDLELASKVLSDGIGPGRTFTSSS